MSVPIMGLLVFALSFQEVSPARARSLAEVRKFKQMTGYPNGRPGMVVDHRIPLCAGGPDTAANMQWQEKQESYRKDVYERQLCRFLEQQRLRVQPLPADSQPAKE